MRIINRLRIKQPKASQGIIFPWKQAFLVYLGVGVTFLSGVDSAQAEAENLLMVSVAPVAKHTNLKTVNAKILIQAPPALVWDLLTDYPALSDILPGYEKSQVMSRTGSTTLMDVAMRVSNLLPLYHYRLRAQANAADYQLSLTRVSGDFKSLNATYKLTPQNRGRATLVTYQLNIDPGFVLPGSTVLIRNNTLKSLNAIEHEAEQAFRRGEIGQR